MLSFPMGYRAWFQCIDPACASTHALDEVVYHCGRCGNLLKVRHDIEALCHRSAVSWMRLFDDRYKTGQWPYGFAIWGKKEWVLVPGASRAANGNVPRAVENGRVAAARNHTLTRPRLWSRRFAVRQRASASHGSP